MKHGREDLGSARLQGFLRLMSEMVAYLEKRTGQTGLNLSPQELILQLKPYMEPLIEYISGAGDADFAKRFKPAFLHAAAPILLCQSP